MYRPILGQSYTLLDHSVDVASFAGLLVEYPLGPGSGQPLPMIAVGFFVQNKEQHKPANLIQAVVPRLPVFGKAILEGNHGRLLS